MNAKNLENALVTFVPFSTAHYKKHGELQSITSCALAVMRAAGFNPKSATDYKLRSYTMFELGNLSERINSISFKLNGVQVEIRASEFGHFHVEGPNSNGIKRQTPGQVAEYIGPIACAR